jgi:hypothetical protein
MILFLTADIKQDGKPMTKILLNWQKIMLVKQDGTDQTLVVMQNGEIIPIANTFLEFKKLLEEHELTLDENSRIIAPDDDGNWLMVD